VHNLVSESKTELKQVLLEKFSIAAIEPTDISSNQNKTKNLKVLIYVTTTDTRVRSVYVIRVLRMLRCYNGKD